MAAVVTVEQRTVVAGGYRLAAWRAGPRGGALPVVCVHGAGISSRTFLPLVERLAGRTETWAVDLPGFGRSSKPPGTLGLAELSDALAEWLQVLDLPPACLLGGSFGCQVATDLAVRHPDRVAAVVLVGPTTDPQARTWWRIAARWLRNTGHESPRMLPPNLADYRDCGMRRVLASFRESMRDRIEDRLPAVAVPALVVRGEQDAIVPQPWAEEVTRLMPQARLATVMGAPHMVPFTAPQELASLVAGFLQEAVHAA